MKDFDTWFEEEGYAEEYRAMFETVWDAALEIGEEKDPVIKTNVKDDNPSAPIWKEQPPNRTLWEDW